MVDTEINKEILRAAAKRPQSYKSAQPSGNSLRKRPNNQVHYPLNSQDLVFIYCNFNNNVVFSRLSSPLLTTSLGKTQLQ